MSDSKILILSLALILSIWVSNVTGRATVRVRDLDEHRCPRRSPCTLGQSHHPASSLRRLLMFSLSSFPLLANIIFPNSCHCTFPLRFCSYSDLAYSHHNNYIHLLKRKLVTDVTTLDSVVCALANNPTSFGSCFSFLLSWSLVLVINDVKFSFWAHMGIVLPCSRGVRHGHITSFELWNVITSNACYFQAKFFKKQHKIYHLLITNELDSRG